jgi:4-amino-4-deoxy-L-arabinose transferase-like glycosyltransferase
VSSAQNGHLHRAASNAQGPDLDLVRWLAVLSSTAIGSDNKVAPEKDMKLAEFDLRNRWQALSVVALLAVAALLRFYHLGYESLWFDEAISFRRSGYPMGELIRESIRAYHNPTYFILLRSFRSFGDSELALRLPSALFGVAKVALTYGLGRMALGHRGGLVAAGVVLISPAQLHYDQEARMYAPLLFCISLALCGLLWLVQRWETAETTDAAIPTGDSAEVRPSRRAEAYAWAAYVLGTIFALYLHNTATLFVGTCWLVAISLFLSCRKSRRLMPWKWLSANVVVLIAFFPWMRTLFVQVDAMTEHGYGRHFPSLAQAMGAIQDVYLMGRDSVLLQLLIVLSAGLGFWSLRHSPRLRTAIVLLAFAPPVLFFVVSLKEPMFLTRLFLWAAIPFSLLVAAGLTHLPSVKARVPFFILVLGLCSHNLWRHYYGQLQKPDWKGAIGMLAREFDDESLVLAVSDREWRLFSYYFERHDAPLPKFPVEFNVAKMRANLPALLQGKKKVFTVRVRNDPDGLAVRTALARCSTLERSFSFGPRLWVERYRVSGNGQGCQPQPPTGAP